MRLTLLLLLAGIATGQSPKSEPFDVKPLTRSHLAVSEDYKQDEAFRHGQKEGCEMFPGAWWIEGKGCFTTDHFCADKRRKLLVDEYDGTHHCILFPPQEPKP